MKRSVSVRLTLFGALITLILFVGATVPTTAQSGPQKNSGNGDEQELTDQEIRDAAVEAFRNTRQYRVAQVLRPEELLPLIEAWEDDFDTEISVKWNSTLEFFEERRIVYPLSDEQSVYLHRSSVRYRAPGLHRSVPYTEEFRDQLNWSYAESITVRHPLNAPMIESLQVEDQSLSQVLRTICAVQNLEYALDSRLDPDLSIQLSIRDRSTSEALSLLSMVANCQIEFLADPYLTVQPRRRGARVERRFGNVENHVITAFNILNLLNTPDLAVNYGAEPAEIESAVDSCRVLVRHAAEGMARQRYIALLTLGQDDE